MPQPSSHQERGGEERRARRGPMGIPRDIQLLATGLAAPYRSLEIDGSFGTPGATAGSLESFGFAGDVWPLRNPLARPSLLAGGNNARLPRNSGSLRLRSSFLVSSSASPRVIAISRPRSQRHCWRLRRLRCRLRRKLRQLPRQRPRLRRRRQRPRFPPRRPKWSPPSPPPPQRRLSRRRRQPRQESSRGRCPISSVRTCRMLRTRFSR